MVNQSLAEIDPKQNQDNRDQVIENQKLKHPPNPDDDYLIAVDVPRVIIHRIHGAKQLIRHAQVKDYIKDESHTPRISLSCHIRARSNGIKWISMVGFGVRFGRIVWQSLRFTRDYADLRSGFSFAGVAQW